MDDGSMQKKAKGTKKCVIQRRIMFVCLMKKPYLKNNKSCYHDMYTEEINKVALSSNITREYKHLTRLQHFHKKHLLLKCVKMKC